MANITDVLLEVFDQSGSAMVRANYRVEATGADATQQQRYRELVELIGVDDLGHEDGQNDVISVISDGTITFDTSHVAFVRAPEVNIPSSALDEDAGVFRWDELRARVSLTPLPPEGVARESNVITRGGPIFEG
jgi:hypothetical protein